MSYWEEARRRPGHAGLEHLDVSSDKLEEVEGGRSGLSHFKRSRRSRRRKKMSGRFMILINAEQRGPLNALFSLSCDLKSECFSFRLVG